MNRGGMDLFRGITYTHSTDREIGVGEQEKKQWKEGKLL